MCLEKIISFLKANISMGIVSIIRMDIAQGTATGLLCAKKYRVPTSIIAIIACVF